MCFLEYNPSPSLYRVHQRLVAGDPTVLPVQDYLVRHADDLSMASSVVKEIIARGSAIESAKHWFVRPYDAMVVEGTRNNMLDMPLLGTAPLARGDSSEVDWAALRAAAVAEHLAECTNNRFYINNDYYSAYVNGSTRLLRPLPEEENQEMRDLIALLDHLKQADGDPLFVVQPVNPFVYEDVRAFTATMNRVKAELDSRGFAYLDLWEDDTAEFQPGVRAGTNSTAMLVGLPERGERPDLILFADTGGERPETYAHRDTVSEWCEIIGFPRIVTVAEAMTLEAECLARNALPGLAYGFKSCSEHFKTRPQKRWLRWSGYSAPWFWVGIDAGEEHRKKYEGTR